MSNSTDRKGASIDADSLPEGSAPRLRLSRETVKSLRVRSGCQTGLLLNGNLTVGQPSINTRVAGNCK
jgi:hypothetical protein